MNRRHILPALFLLFACSSPKLHIPNPYAKQFILESDEAMSLSPSKIEDAGDLAIEFPDETLINNEINVVIDFKFNEDYDSSQYYRKYLAENRKADSIERAERKKYRNTSIPELTEHPIPDGEVFVNTHYDVEYTTIKDFIEEPIYLHYNSMVKLKSVHFTMDNNTANVEKIDKSFDGSSYFKTDDRYMIYNIHTPIRGSLIKYEYTEECRDAKFQSTYYIPEEHFTQKKVIKIALPKYLDMEIIEKNFGDLKFTKDTIEEYPRYGDRSEKTKYLVYTFRRVKGFERSSLSRGPSYDYPMLYFRYKSASFKNKSYNIIRDTDDLYSWYKLVSSNLMDDTSAFASFTKDLVKEIKSDEERIKKVFYWIQDNIRYIAFEDGIAGFRPDECAEVYRKRYGDCKGMANLTKNMLKVLGYDARLVWIGTKHQNFSYKEPGMPVDNHAICAVKLKGKTIYLDGTETFVAMHDYANRIQGRQCIVENGESYTLERIPEWGYEHNEEKTVEKMTIDNQNLQTDVKITFKGESKLNLIRFYNYLSGNTRTDVLINYVTNSDRNFIATDFKSSNLKDRDADTYLEYHLEVHNRVYKMDGKTYVNPEWEREYDGYDLDTGRTTDLDLGYKHYINRELSIELKPGQKLVSAPKSINIDNDYYSFKLEYVQKGNIIYYKKSIINKKDYLPASMVKQFQMDVKTLTQFYNTYIVIQ